MKNKVIFAAILAVATVAGGIWMFDRAGDATRAGPDLMIDDVVWGTRIYEGKGDHQAHGIWIDLIAPAGFDAKEFVLDTDYLQGVCRAVLSKSDAFTPDGVEMSDVTHIDFNFDFAGEKGWPVETTWIATRSACTDRFFYGGHGKYAFSTDDGRFSNHSFEETATAFLLAWGLTVPNVSFATVNGDRIVRVDYGYVKAIERDLVAFNSLNLCIFAISNWKQQMSVLGIKIDPAKYPVMEIQIVEEISTGIFTTMTKTFGGAKVLLRDGRCVLPQDGSA